MRLWHECLIPLLPKPQLLGQHRECCALRGNGWGRKHATVDYVFTYSPYKLFQYHLLVMSEMERRGYKVSKEWWDKDYRGKICKPYRDLAEVPASSPIYVEHNESYLEECRENLRQKNVFIQL